jgi:tight adherence protein B
MKILIIATLFFIAILFFLIVFYMWYSSVKASPSFELKRRLRKLAMETGEKLPAEVRLEILIDMTQIEKFLYKFKLIRKLDALLDKAGLKYDIKIFLLVVLTFAATGFFIGLVLRRGIIFPIVFMLVAIVIPFIYLNVKKAKRILHFTEQFPNALDMISRSLKAGHSFITAVRMVGTEMSEPVSGIFKTVYDEQTMGLSTQEALNHMVLRMNTPDVRFFLTAVSIYREIGGNLSELLERLAHTIRERIKIRRQVRVYTAQARLSGYILSGLPLFMALFFFFMAPDYIGELWAAKMGRILIAVAIVAQIIGFLIIRKIINIRI